MDIKTEGQKSAAGTLVHFSMKQTKESPTHISGSKEPRWRWFYNGRPHTNGRRFLCQGTLWMSKRTLKWEITAWTVVGLNILFRFFQQWYRRPDTQHHCESAGDHEQYVATLLVCFSSCSALPGSDSLDNSVLAPAVCCSSLSCFNMTTLPRRESIKISPQLV